MSRKRKRQFRYVTFIIVPALLLLAALVPAFLSATDEANALSTDQWETVRGYIAEYFGGPQYDAGLEGEAGFRMNKTNLWNRLDSNGDIAPNAGTGVGGNGVTVTGVLGEGDDAANRPVLIDNLYSQGNVIPGTEFRCNWSANENCFSDASITAIRQIVDNHQAAGFSTDIVDYCLTAHTAAPATGGFGIIAQVPGALASDTSLTPNVYTFEWARNGWRDQLSNPTDGGLAIAAPETSAGGFAAPGTVADCDASATDYALVRCQANWAISSTGGSTGNGQTSTATIALAGQSVDIRVGATTTMSSAGANLQIPIDELFEAASLQYLSPTASTVLVSRTQMGGDAAIGLEMLGYNNIANSYINGGIYRWNAAAGGELQVDQDIGLPLQSLAAYSAPGPVDTTGPSVTSVVEESITASSADIHRVAGEPATLKVEYGTTSGDYTEEENNTVLNADKTVSLTGLAESTTYYYRTTSYDGYANGTVSTEGSFTTLDITAPVITDVLPTGDIYTDSATISAYLSDTGSGIDADYTMVHLDGGEALAGCVKTASSISCDVTGLGVGAHTIEVMARDNATPTPLTATEPGGFTVVDNVNPTVDHTGPTATVTSVATTITGTWSDPSPSSGVDETSLNVSLNGGPATNCTIAGSAITCNVSGLSTGTYSVLMSGADLAGNSDTDTGTLDVNTSAPTITPGSYVPADNAWTADDTPLISFDYTAGGTVTAATISVDGVPCTPVTVGQTQASCTPAAQTDGPKDVHVTVNVDANQSIADWTFNVDTTAPTSGNGAPTAWQNAAFDVYLSCDDGAGVGCGTDAIQYRVNSADCPDWQCELEVPGDPSAPDPSWITGNNVAIDTEGVQVIDFFSTDTLGNAEDPFQTVNVGLDMSVPVIEGDYLPLADSFTSDTTPTISANYSDTYSGLDSVELAIDGEAVGTCTPGTTSLSCDAPELTDGQHTAAVTVTDNAGNSATTSWDFNVDTAGPVITNILPAGNTPDTTPVISATLADDAGVDTTTVEVFLDGSETALTGCVVTTTSVSCAVTTDLLEGDHTIHITADDVLVPAQTGTGDGTFTIVPERTYYFPWYDNNAATGMTYDSILITNEGGSTAAAQVYIDNAPVGAPMNIPVEEQAIWTSPTQITNGPVKVVSTNGEPLLVSQRVIYKDSFNELMAVEDIDLSDDNYFSWYDNNPAWGMNGNWILVTNAGETSAAVNVYVGDQDTPKTTLDIAAGEQGLWQSPTPLTDGPVRVVDTNGNKLAVSQRVIYKDAFSEVMGVPFSQIDTEGYFTWYDNNPAWGMNGNWILATNLGDAATDVEIYIGNSDSAVETVYDVAVGESVNWQSPTTLTDGPVRVMSTDAQTLLVSQRVLYKDSFEEVQGVSPNDMVVSGGFNWYDNTPASGMMGDWLLIGNQLGTDETVNIDIAGVARSWGDGGTDITVSAGGNVTPTWPNLMDGPVEITCSTCTGSDALFMSQRVIYKNSFNELIIKKYDW